MSKIEIHFPKIVKDTTQEQTNITEAFEDKNAKTENSDCKKRVPSPPPLPKNTYFHRGGSYNSAHDLKSKDIPLEIEKEILSHPTLGDMINPKIVKSINPRSAHATRIYFIQDEKVRGDLRVIKLYKCFRSYIIDAKYILQDLYNIELIKSLSENNADLRIPEFSQMQYQYNLKNMKAGNQLYFGVMRRAKGIPLAEVLRNIETYSKEKIRNIFHAIGEQEASLHILTSKRSSSHHFHSDISGKFFRHDDPQANNLFIDINTLQFTWIDFAGSIFVESCVFNEYVKPNLAAIKNEIEKLNQPYESLTEEVEFFIVRDIRELKSKNQLTEKEKLSLSNLEDFLKNIKNLSFNEIIEKLEFLTNESVKMRLETELKSAENDAEYKENFFRNKASKYKNLLDKYDLYVYAHKVYLEAQYRIIKSNSNNNEIVDFENFKQGYKKWIEQKLNEKNELISNSIKPTLDEGSFDYENFFANADEEIYLDELC